MHHIGKSLIKALGLIIVVLLMVEAGLTIWTRDAYRMPNFYAADPVLGVRLIPNTTMRLAYHGVYPATEVNINSDGFRGPDFPQSTTNDIFVFGDSLAFGLGVTDDETFAHQLDTMLGPDVRVFNYSVPSHGLHEQNLLVQQVLEKHTVNHLIYSISVGRFLGKPPKPYMGRLKIEHGWLGIKGDGVKVFPKFLPGPVIRWSHFVNLFRQRDKTYTQAELATMVINERWTELMKSAERASTERKRLQDAQWAELRGPDGTPRAWSHLLPFLRDLKSALKNVDTELTLLLLPQDVTFEKSSCSKYGLKPQDATPVHTLIEDFKATAGALGLTMIDATPSLTLTGAPAVLSRDWHFSSLGHQTIAQDLLHHLQSRPVEP